MMHLLKDAAWAVACVLFQPDEKVEPVSEIDTRGIPTNECLICGSNVFLIRAGFEDYDIAYWFTDAECADCGTPLTAPTPCDDPFELDV